MSHRIPCRFIRKYQCSNGLWISCRCCILTAPSRAIVSRYSQRYENGAHNHRLYYHRLYVNVFTGGIPVTPPDWALRVRALRKNLHLKQVEFAAHFSVTQAAVSRWENGAKEPSPENYIRMGNIAREPECFWFWKKAGLDLSRIRTSGGKFEST